MHGGTGALTLLRFHGKTCRMIPGRENFRNRGRLVNTDRDIKSAAEDIRPALLSFSHFFLFCSQAECCWR